MISIAASEEKFFGDIYYNKKLIHLLVKIEVQATYVKLFFLIIENCVLGKLCCKIAEYNRIEIERVWGYVCLEFLV